MFSFSTIDVLVGERLGSRVWTTKGGSIYEFRQPSSSIYRIQSRIIIK